MGVFMQPGFQHIVWDTLSLLWWSSGKQRCSKAHGSYMRRCNDKQTGNIIFNLVPTKCTHMLTPLMILTSRAYFIYLNAIELNSMALRSRWKTKVDPNTACSDGAKCLPTEVETDRTGNSGLWLIEWNLHHLFEITTWLCFHANT